MKKTGKTWREFNQVTQKTVNSPKPVPHGLALSPIQRSKKKANAAKKRLSMQYPTVANSQKLSLAERSNDSDLEPYHQYLDKWSPENGRFS
jgi:hypothetical protein